MGNVARTLRASDEGGVWQLLNRERAGLARIDVLVRLHARACRLRMRRERAALSP